MDDDAIEKKDPDFQFSPDTIEQLNAIDDVTPRTIRACRQICAMHKADPDSTPTGERKTELQRLQGRLERLTDAMEQLTLDSYVDLLEASKLSADSTGPKINLDDIIQFRRETVMLTSLATQTLKILQPKSGRPPAKGQKLAFLVACKFRIQKLPLSSSESASYMRVLELLFAELIPEAKESGYIRHGKWAIKKIKRLNSE